MKVTVQRDRKAEGGHHFNGGWGVMWNSRRRNDGVRAIHVYVRLIPGVALHLTWLRAETTETDA